MVTKISLSYSFLFFLGGQLNELEGDRECPGVNGDPELVKVDRLLEDGVELEGMFSERISISISPPE